MRLFEEAHHDNSDSPINELARLLIGTHHGHGRAFVPFAKDRNPVEVALNHGGQQVAVCSDHRLYRLDCGWLDLFWRMVRRYGWWGVSYLEALLITADHLVSAAEQRQPANQPEGAAGDHA